MYMYYKNTTGKPLTYLVNFLFWVPKNSNSDTPKTCCYKQCGFIIMCPKDAGTGKQCRPCSDCSFKFTRSNVIWVYNSHCKQSRPWSDCSFNLPEAVWSGFTTVIANRIDPDQTAFSIYQELCGLGSDLSVLKLRTIVVIFHVSGWKIYDCIIMFLFVRIFSQVMGIYGFKL